MGKKYLETKKGSIEEQVSLLEYYDPQYEGMTVAEVAALDEDALGVNIAQGLMKHAKKGGFKIGGKAWNSSAMLGIRKKIGTSASKARAVKTDLEKQKTKTKAQAAANADKAELDARKKAKKDGKSPEEIDAAGADGRKEHDKEIKKTLSKGKDKDDKETDTKEPEDKDKGSDDTAAQATSTDADASKSDQDKETGDSEGGTAHTSGDTGAAALGSKEKENPLAGDGDKEKTATPEPEKSGSEKPKEPEKTGDKQPEPTKPKGKHGGSRKGSGRKGGGKNQPKPGSPAKPDKPTPPKPKTEGVLKMTSQRMPDMREALKQVRETETKTHIVEVHEIGTDEYREYTEKVTPGQKTEKLSAKQKKIDVDGDGEIEGSDLAKLRKKKTESQKSSVREMWAQAYKEVLEHKGNKPHKHPHEPVEEDDELDEGYIELTFKDKQTAEQAYNYINNEIWAGGNPPYDDIAQEGNEIQIDTDGNLNRRNQMLKDLKALPRNMKFKVSANEETEKDEKEDKKLTMTGKKKDSVEINPNIKMEKKKQKNW